MYICDKCGSRVDELPTKKEHRGEYWGDAAYEEVTAYECGCGGYFDECEQCPICGDCFVEGAFRGCCGECKDEILNVENALLYIKEKKLQQEFFVEEWTGANVAECTKHLLQICEKDWETAFVTYRWSATTSIIEFIEEDLTDFVEWFTDREEQDD